MKCSGDVSEKPAQNKLRSRDAKKKAKTARKSSGFFFNCSFFLEFRKQILHLVCKSHILYFQVVGIIWRNVYPRLLNNRFRLYRKLPGIHSPLQIRAMCSPERLFRTVAGCSLLGIPTGYIPGNRHTKIRSTGAGSIHKHLRVCLFFKSSPPVFSSTNPQDAITGVHVSTPPPPRRRYSTTHPKRAHKYF